MLPPARRPGRPAPGLPGAPSAAFGPPPAVPPRSLPPRSLPPVPGAGRVRGRRRARRRIVKRPFAAAVLIVALAAAAWGVVALLGDGSAFLAGGAAPADPLTLSAEAGAAAAQYALAERYRVGRDAARDPARAVRWYEAAARQGHVAAQVALARMYETGDGIPFDYRRAAEWYRLAAGVGRDADARFALGELYFTGRGVMHDTEQAIEWWRRAAGQGHAVAQYLMGMVYAEGWLVDRDDVAAYAWLTLAARQAARVVAANAKYDPVGRLRAVAKRMNRFQVSQARRKVAAFRPAP